MFVVEVGHGLTIASHNQPHAGHPSQVGVKYSWPSISGFPHGALREFPRRLPKHGARPRPRLSLDAAGDTGLPDSATRKWRFLNKFTGMHADFNNHRSDTDDSKKSLRPNEGRR